MLVRHSDVIVVVVVVVVVEVVVVVDVDEDDDDFAEIMQASSPCTSCADLSVHKTRLTKHLKNDKRSNFGRFTS